MKKKIVFRKLIWKLFFIYFTIGLLFSQPRNTKVSISVGNNEVDNMTEVRYAQLQAWERAASEECGMDITTSTRAVGFEYLSEIINYNVQAVVLKDTLITYSSNDTLIAGKPVTVFNYTFNVTLECKEFHRPNFDISINGQFSYNHGDPLMINVIPTQDVFLYVFGMEENGSMTLLYPAYFYPIDRPEMQFSHENPLFSPFMPGLNYLVENEKKEGVMEAIVAVATKDPWPLKNTYISLSKIEKKDQTVTLEDYNSWLSKIPLNERVLAWRQITISGIS